MKVYSRIFVIFALYLTLLVEQNFSDYSNEAGKCVNYSSYISCRIYNNDTQAIKDLLMEGSQGNQYHLRVYKRYSLDKGYLTLDIEIPPNIRTLYLYLSYGYNHEEIILKLLQLIPTSALRLLALRGCKHYVFAEGALRAPRQFKNV